MAITALPTPPGRSDTANFATRGDAFLGALPTFATEANALQDDVNAKQVSASSSASTATTKAGEALASAYSASTSAGTATTKAGEALTSANTASTQAGIATTKAEEAAASASSIVRDGSGGVAGLTLFKINMRNALNTITSFLTNTNTVARTYTFQDRDGTIADDTDLALKLTKSSNLYDLPSATTARTNLGVATVASVSGLVGNVNATTPLTKYDLSANSVVVRSSNGAVVARYATGTLTCDLGLAGSAENGRDQAGVFTANSFVRLYFIWNGTTLATIASLSATAPTLPTGYTHYALATVLRWNASSNIIPVNTRGCRAFYDVAVAGAVRILSAGKATTMTAVSAAGVVPPENLCAQINFSTSIGGLAAGTDVSLYYRPTGSSITGISLIIQTVQAAAITSVAATTLDLVLETSQQLDYKLASTVSSGGLYIEVLGFTIPNGDC